jgi:hypothetical protein
VRQQVVQGLCENTGCHQVGKLNRFQGKYLCPNCLNPTYKEQDVTQYLFQRDDANLPENVPLPFLEYGDIVEVRKGVDRFAIKQLRAKQRYGHSRNWAYQDGNG